MSWKNLEDTVRNIASYIWDAPAISKTIDEVQIDCVVELRDDYLCLVEVSQNNTLEKVRTDISKLAALNFSLMGKGIYSEKYIVLSEKPTNSMRKLGNESKITVLSVDEFEKKWFDYKKYIYLRSQQSFGSVINLENGTPENDIYIPVSYIDIKTGERYDIESIAKKLEKGSKIILKGSFGTGKSRCVKQLFEILSSKHDILPIYTIAINLREHWGAKNYREVLQRHFEDLSIDSKGFNKISKNRNLIFLLDGFDEIGSQSWSIDPEKMHSVRARAVVSIKDMILNVQGGCLITGREHYFNSDKEMLDCLGLDTKTTLILECSEEFNEEQIRTYLEKNCNKSVHYIPQWLPKRPLIMSIAIHNISDIFDQENSIVNECDFWDKFLTLLSKREARISSVLHDETIKDIMVRVARISRIKDKDFGPITLSDLNKAFEDITGERPNEESAIMLHRLPGLGRINADSNDRMFVDSYILNGLRAEDIIQAVEKSDNTVFDEKWINPLNIEGINILSNYIEYDEKRFKDFLNSAVLCARKNNSMFVADIVSAICKIPIYSIIDFKNVNISDIQIYSLDFSNKQIKNMSFENVWINDFDITNANLINTNFINSVIDKIKGITSKNSLPDCFVACDISEYQPVSTVTRIKRANLNRAQTILVTIIKKIFSTVTKGNGRKEEALLRGLGDRGDSKLCDKILNKMITDEIITKHKGKEGWIYSPILKNTERMCKILSDLSNSQDDLWIFATNLN